MPDQWRRPAPAPEPQQPPTSPQRPSTQWLPQDNPPAAATSARGSSGEQVTGYGGWEHPGYAPRTPPQPEEAPPDGGIWRWFAIVTLSLGALTTLLYAIWAAWQRRGIFADFDPEKTKKFNEKDWDALEERAKNSDSLDEIFVYITIALVVIGLIFWAVTRVLGRLPLGSSGFTGIALVIVGAMVAAGGAYVTSMVGGDASEVGKGVTGYWVIAGGAALVCAGLVTGVISLFLAVREDDEFDFGEWAS